MKWAQRQWRTVAAKGGAALATNAPGSERCHRGPWEIEERKLLFFQIVAEKRKKKHTHKEGAKKIVTRCRRALLVEA